MKANLTGTGILSAVTGLLLTIAAHASESSAAFTPDKDPAPAIQNQIRQMMSQERAVLHAVSATRLSEIGGYRPVTGHGASDASAAMALRDKQEGLSHSDVDSLASFQANAAAAKRGFGEAGAIVGLSAFDGRPMTRVDIEHQCLSQAIYFEARGETRKGRQAVGEVILNRVKSRRYPNSICEVVQQGADRRHACQFSYYCDGLRETIREPRVFDDVERLAARLMTGEISPLTKGATHYHADWVSPSWARKLTRTAQIGSHIFYRLPTTLSSR